MISNVMTCYIMVYYDEICCIMLYDMLCYVMICYDMI